MIKQIHIHKNNFSKGVLMVLLGAICFSSKGVFAKLSYQHGASAIDILNLRMLFSLPFYILIYFNEQRKNKISITNSIKRNILIIGIIGYYLAALFDFIGLQYISANLERIVIFTYPTFVLILGYILFKRNINKIQLISILLCYAGIVISFYSDIQHFDFKNGIMGISFVLLSSLTYAFYLVKSDNIIKEIGTLRFTCLSMIISCCAVLIHNFILNGFNLFSYSKTIYLLGFVIATISTVLPSFFISYGISLIGSSNMSIVASFGPISTMFLAYFILQEKITLLHVVGTFLVLVGVYLIGKKGK